TSKSISYIVYQNVINFESLLYVIIYIFTTKKKKKKKTKIINNKKLVCLKYKLFICLKHPKLMRSCVCFILSCFSILGWGVMCFPFKCLGEKRLGGKAIKNSDISDCVIGCFQQYFSFATTYIDQIFNRRQANVVFEGVF